VAVATQTPAVRAIEYVLDALDAAGVAATRDAGAFHPRPVGVLVGLPSLTFRALAAFRFTVPVHVVSADALNTPASVDRLYALADLLISVLQTDTYRPEDWSGGVNTDPLPAVTLAVTVSVFQEA
jgi:hypothetical protein